ncbi:hypothetical protein QN367_06830 [Cryobacterium sp. RTS3]|uniref:hypothetical protein n=1 Tax=Cryobacterium sp. RTS3 TaxID=3048643 RepID=UPI002B23346F|nr:hypothetical protein [Cryobacterium sp. RTS3]MEA9998807.1 hypothetical protein [Cryobacterium sp. RTS3]
MSAIAEEIAAAKTAHDRKLKRLREKAHRQEERLDARVLQLLRGRLRPDVLEAISAEALQQLESEVAVRSRRAREARQASGVARSSGPNMMAVPGDRAANPGWTS